MSIQMVISGKGEITGATTKPGSKNLQLCVKMSSAPLALAPNGQLES
jgi:hypothetical protein